MLKNKVIVVTGGSGLLGKEMVSDIMKKQGIAVNLDVTCPKKLVGNEIFCDVTDLQSIQTAIDAIIKHYRRIDGLVNNAYPRTDDWENKFEDVTPQSWRTNLDMQLTSCFVMTQTVVKHLLKAKSGSIVNIASIYGVVGNDFTVYEGTDMTSPAAYSAIKGGIINFTRCLASYFGKNNIRANCVSPGGIFNNQNPVFVKNYKKKVPMRRMGNPDDIAPAVSFLLSDDAKYITGHNLIVDGGWTAI